MSCPRTNIQRPTPAKQLAALDAICPYFTRFPLSYPIARLRSARPGAWVLDPFCGAGTTVLAARQLDMGAVGADSSAVAVAIAQAKLLSVAPEAIVARLRTVPHEDMPDIETPQGEFWRKCYAPNTLAVLCRFRQYFMDSPEGPADHMLRALLLGLLHGPKHSPLPCLSNHLPAAFAPAPEKAVAFWKRNRLEARDIDVDNAIQNRALQLLKEPTPAGRGSILTGDSRHLCFSESPLFDWVITSPPYYGMNTYRRHQWLRLWLLGGPAEPMPDETDQINQTTLEQYVDDLARVWRNVARSCRPGACLRLRFGAVPGATTPHPFEVIRTSLRNANAGWKITTRRPVAPQKPKGHAEFDNPAQWPENEFELFARLET